MGRKYKSYTYEEYERAMELHCKYKLGYRRISRMLGISEYTVRNWLYYGIMPPTAKWTAKPSNELAYAIGVLYDGDGSVSKTKDKNKPGYEYKIKLAVIDKEFGETFSTMTAKFLNKKYIEPWWSEKEKKWWVVYYSKAFYEWYKKCEKRGLEGFKPYIEYNKETVKYYLRGIYDSDGNNYRCKLIRLYNNNIELLRYVQYLLKKYFDIETRGPYLVYEAGTAIVINGIKTHYNDNHYSIHISKENHVQKFLEEIGFSITRKQLGLEKNKSHILQEWDM